MSVDNALPGLELDCAPDPCCPIDCEACAKLPYGESVRKEQLAMMVASIYAQEVFSKVTTETDKLVLGSVEAKLMDLSMAAMMYGSAFASVIGLLLKEAPELAHKAIAIHQDMYSNGDVWHTEQLYAEAEKVHEQHKTVIAERIAALPQPYLIWCRSDRCWWKPNSAGYTADVWRAGRYTPDEAGAKTFHQPDHIAVLAPEGGMTSMTVADLAGVAVTMQGRIDAAVKAMATVETTGEVL